MTRLDEIKARADDERCADTGFTRTDTLWLVAQLARAAEILRTIKCRNHDSCSAEENSDDPCWQCRGVNDFLVEVSR